MSSHEAKVLTGLMERRALQAAFDALAEPVSLAEQSERAAKIADHGSSVLPVLIAKLDTEDPQLRGGLGLVAQRLDRDLVASALKATVRARERSDQARVTALTILDRYLNEPLDEGLLASIHDPNGLAVQSLHELIRAMEQDPSAVVEYLNQLAEQPPDVPGMLMQALPELMPNPHLVTLMRMFAQGEDDRLAQQALELLGRTRAVESMQALVSLVATLPPKRTALADRGLRKLRLSGVQPSEPAPASEWRALLSPVDGAGAQAIWFVHQPAGSDRRTAKTVLTKDPQGIVAAFELADAPDAAIPPPVPDGEILSVPQAGERRPLMLLGVSFEIGKAAVQDALRLNWDTGQLPPLSYRYIGGTIWQYGGGDPTAYTLPEADDQSRAALSPMTGALLDHPAFAGWFWQAPPLYDAAERLGQRHDLAERLDVVTRLAGASFGQHDVTSYRRRLHRMAIWLGLARQPEVALLAQAAAAQLEVESPSASPFVRRLIGIGLDVAVINLQSGYDLRRAT